MIPNFGLLHNVGIKIYSIFNCLHPLVITIVVIRAIAVNAHSLER